MSVTPADSGPVLVCGGAGYIGSHTVRLLEQSGLETRVLDNLSTGHREAVGVPFEEADLGDPDGLREVFARVRPSAVMHFAAKCYVGESVEDPAKYYRENVVNTFNLLEAMRQSGCRDVVFSSTAATYGEPRAETITEEHPQDPINPYGRTKLVIEHMLRDYARAYGLRFAALRYFNAAGASPAGDLGEHHDPETHLIPLVLSIALEKRSEILVFGDDWGTRDGTCERDFIHVDDLAEAHRLALGALREGLPEICCNLGTGSGFTVREVISAAREVTGHAIPERVVERRSGDPARLVSGGDRARELLGWEPRRSELRTILADAWRFHSAHPNGYGG